MDPMFKVGDKVVRHTSSQSFTGTVIQIEGGPEGDLTEVYWPHYDQPTWVPTKYLDKED